MKIIGCLSLLLLSSFFECSDAFMPPSGLKEAMPIMLLEKSTGLSSRDNNSSPTQLFSEKKKDNNNKGVYVRPSAAIERGSGFFIPGLEGPRVRLLFGLTVLILTAVNHFLGDAPPTSSLSEALAVGYAVLLLLQAAIEFGKEDMGYVVVAMDDKERKQTKAAAASTEGMVQRWAGSDDDDEGWKERVKWSAASYVSLTPATQMMLLENDTVVYSLGKDESTTAATTAADGCKAALETLSQAKSGRVSLPDTHPAAMALAPDARCIVLQTIDENRCWMMMSDNQLLQAFTKQDLKWLGQLGSYVVQE